MSEDKCKTCGGKGKVTEQDSFFGWQYLVNCPDCKPAESADPRWDNAMREFRELQAELAAKDKQIADLKKQVNELITAKFKVKEVVTKDCCLLQIHDVHSTPSGLRIVVNEELTPSATSEKGGDNEK